MRLTIEIDDHEKPASLVRKLPDGSGFARPCLVLDLWEGALRANCDSADVPDLKAYNYHRRYALPSGITPEGAIKFCEKHFGRFKRLLDGATEVTENGVSRMVLNPDAEEAEREISEALSAMEKAGEYPRVRILNLNDLSHPIDKILRLKDVQLPPDFPAASREQQQTFSRLLTGWENDADLDEVGRWIVETFVDPSDPVWVDGLTEALETERDRRRETELLIREIAYTALKDNLIFNDIAERLDLADEELVALREEFRGELDQEVSSRRRTP